MWAWKASQILRSLASMLVERNMMTKTSLGTWLPVSGSVMGSLISANRRKALPRVARKTMRSKRICSDCGRTPAR